MGAEVKRAFSSLNDWRASEGYTRRDVLRLVMAVSGEAMELKFLMKRR